ncbi:MAG: AmmeMemoRadiSam system radical SAM enzyme [Bacteroidales bacterium]
MASKINKRDFIRYLAAGAGVSFFGFAGNRIFAHSNPGKTLQPNEKELWKWSKEAVYYTATPRGPKCQLCPNECTVKEDDTGDCRTRITKDNKLYSIVYGNPCSVHVDPIEKKPLYHFKPESRIFSVATAGCNLACLNCQNWNISQKSPYDTRNYDLMPQKLVASAINKDCNSIAYTYTEPIVFYEYMVDSAKIAHQKGVKNVMVSAGYIKERPLREVCKYIDAANIDLKSFSNDVYMRLNAGNLDQVLSTLKIMKEEGVWLEITNLIVPEWTDDMDMIKEMCEWLYNNGFENSPLHFSRFQPMYKLKHLHPTPVSVLEEAREIAMSAGLNYVYIGNVPGTEAANTYCPSCGEKIIGRRGYQITENHINSNKCEFCGEEIAGVW